MKLRYNYRARVGSQAERVLVEEWRDVSWLWNQAVTAKKYGYWVSDKDLTFWRNDPETAWLKKGSSVVQQQTLRTFWASKGKKRYKSLKKDQPSLQYTRFGFTLKDGVLKLAGGIKISVVWSRELPSVPSSVRVYRDVLGQWWVSFVVEVEQEQLPATGKSIGIDWGVKEIATTTSDLHDLLHPEHGKKSAQTLGRYQRQMARRKPTPGAKASRGYKEAKRSTALTYAEIRNQRQDTARKWVRAVVRDHDQIAVEDFKPKFMAKNRGLAKKAADAAIGATKRELIEYAKRVGRKVVLVPPAYTTMDCSNCETRAKSPLDLSERVFECYACGLIIPRDKNSARVVLAAAGFNRADVESIRPGKKPSRVSTLAA